MKALHIQILSAVFVLVWTSGYVVGAWGTQVIAPETVTLWRFLGAAVVLALLAAVRRDRWPSRRDALRYAGIGVLMFGVQFSALYYGLSVGVPAATTALIACSAPVAVAALSSVLGWERLSRVQWYGVAIGAVGVVVTLADRVGRPPQLIDLVWTLIGLAGLAGGTLLTGRMRTSAAPTTVAALEVGGGALPMLVIAPLSGSLAIPVTAHALTAFVWLMLVAGVGAPLLMLTLLRERGAVGTSSLLFVVPALTAVVSWPVLGQPLGATALVGLAIAGIGLTLTLRGRRAPVSVLRASDDPCASVDSAA